MCEYQSTTILFFCACESIKCDLICLCQSVLPGGGGGIPPCIMWGWPKSYKYNMFTEKSDRCIPVWQNLGFLILPTLICPHSKS